MKIKDIIKVHVAISELVAADASKRLVLHSAVRIKLAGVLRRSRPIVEDFSNENNRLVSEYGTPIKDSPGEFEVKASSDKYPEFKKARDEAMEADEEFTVPVFRREELFGKSEDEAQQNQIPMNVLEVFLEFGIIPE